MLYLFVCCNVLFLVFLWGLGKPWFLNVENGEQGEGAPTGAKPTCTLTMNDEDFGKMFSGQLQSSSAFMSGNEQLFALAYF